MNFRRTIFGKLCLIMNWSSFYTLFKLWSNHLTNFCIRNFWKLLNVFQTFCAIPRAFLDTWLQNVTLLWPVWNAMKQLQVNLFQIIFFCWNLESLTYMYLLFTNSGTFSRNGHPILNYFSTAEIRKQLIFLNFS